MESNDLCGIVNVLKPPGMTSHDVIYFMRRTFKTKKAGHTGTLDPGAAGVLPVCLGKATRIIEYMAEDIKQYRAELTLGRSTDTQDGFGETVAICDASGLGEETVTQAIMSLKGEQNQIPPMVSALKHKGKKLYELAREGVVIDRDPRRITIFDVTVIRCMDFGTPNPRVLFDIKCSKGTYVRTICHDLGEFFNCGGFMSFLVRTATGSFHINNASTLEEIRDLAENDRSGEIIIPISDVVPFEPVWVEDAASIVSVKHGNRLYMSEVVGPDGLAVGQIVKLMNRKQGCLAIAKVIPEPETCGESTVEKLKFIFQPIKVLF